MYRLTEPSEEWRPFQAALRGNARVLGKHASQHQDVHLSLMIAHKNYRAHVERILACQAALPLHAAGDPERDARYEPHGPLERPRNCPLAESAVAHQSQKNACDDTVRGTHCHQNEGGDGEGDEGHELCWTGG